ncbi:hypothetical protein KVR01_000673 [Diaporthe batatas]|uniref:uncharacterized protein n=1 Tax=Diaporthe batatas TaxID=748121 RepID=UPI001D04E5D0|nr:uncharacterized protein KVR01_000673 [Diaporthe batatas]KAG8169928.1 hypothetical protein KVR01_000673 [Diaporthe batatas]
MTPDGVDLPTLNHTQALVAESLLSTRSPRATCDMGTTLVRYQYQIFIYDVPPESIDGICGGLWAGLKRHWLCTVSSPHTCGNLRDGDGKTLVWNFHVAPYLCNKGMVQSAFWEATKNKFGAINECNMRRRIDGLAAPLELEGTQ